MDKVRPKQIQPGSNGQVLTTSGGTVVWATGSGATFQMALGGKIPTASLPLSSLGVEIASQASSLTEIKGRRGTAGASGTTTIQLEVNGSPVTGATLSWATSDGAYALKTATFASTPVAAGDRISFRVTSGETNAYDIFVEAN
jgi:hypothetical protein